MRRPAPASGGLAQLQPLAAYGQVRAPRQPPQAFVQGLDHLPGRGAPEPRQPGLVHRGVVVDDGAGRGAAGHGRVGRVAQDHGEGLVPLSQPVVGDRHRDRCLRAAGREGQQVRLGRVILVRPRRAVGGPAVDGHRPAAGQAQGHREEDLSGALRRLRVGDGQDRQVVLGDRHLDPGRSQALVVATADGVDQGHRIVGNRIGIMGGSHRHRLRRRSSPRR